MVQKIFYIMCLEQRKTKQNPKPPEMEPWLQTHPATHHKLHQPQQSAAHNNPPPTTDPQANHNNKPTNPSFNQIQP